MINFFFINSDNSPNIFIIPFINLFRLSKENDDLIHFSRLMCVLVLHFFKVSTILVLLLMNYLVEINYTK